MKNKILISTLMLLFITALLCSYSFASNMMQSAGNAVRNAGNAIGNTAAQAGNTIVNGTRNLINDAGNLGNNTMHDAQNTTNNTSTIYDTNNDDYTAQRTAAGNTGLFGMSNTMSTWLILGIVGAVIVGLIWYYGSQYEHRHNTND